jgi:protein-L-isoaspartate(D-aspartate) O-methyltransferase
MSDNGHPVASLEQSFTLQRLRMVEEQLVGRSITDQRVLDAMRKVPRHEFVPVEEKGEAYGDHPIPIGEGQTISQPYIVAAMLEALTLQPSDRVLEVGTGSGYLTALLVELTAFVYSIERHAALAEKALSILQSFGYQNVRVLVGDGSQGLPAIAPFDAIIVSAAAPQAPPALFQQLVEGGRMIVPVGSAYAQELHLVRKVDRTPVTTRLEGCRFVPLVGVEGFSSE